MKTLEKHIAQKLIEYKAIKLQPNNPFKWDSGWVSPIYCDNRKLLSYPAVRTFIKIQLARMIAEEYPDATALASVATGAIAQGALVADLLNLPFAYVRTTPKDHGLENLVEGELRPGAKVVVIEDIITTGQNALKVADTVRLFGCEAIGIAAVYTHAFSQSIERFQKAHMPVVSLCNYEAVIEEALRIKYISQADMAALLEWRQNPSEWSPAHSK